MTSICVSNSVVDTMVCHPDAPSKTRCSFPQLLRVLAVNTLNTVSLMALLCLNRAQGYSPTLSDLEIPRYKYPVLLPQFGSLPSSRAPPGLSLGFCGHLTAVQLLLFPSPASFTPPPTSIGPKSSTLQNSACLKIFLSESASPEKLTRGIHCHD